MSGISANGHNFQHVTFWHLYDKLMSNSVGNSQLNKSFFLEKNSVHQVSGFICKLEKGKRSKLNPDKKSSSARASSNRSSPNSENKGKSEFSPDNNELSRKKIKVLIAEDDEVSSQLLVIVLKDISNEMIRTRTGRETIEQCKKHQDIDLILMDIKMPDLDGLETTKKIREFNKEIYIIAQTARALEGDREEALFAGCNDYIAKPLDRILLLEKIKKIL